MIKNQVSYFLRHSVVTTGNAVVTSGRKLRFFDGEFWQVPRLTVLVEGRLSTDLVEVNIVAVAAYHRQKSVDDRLQPLHLLLLLPNRVQIVDAIKLKLGL